MSDRSAIEWTDATWNPIRARSLPFRSLKGSADCIGWYCEHVSPGCANCYAESMNKRLGTGLPFKPGHRKDVEIFVDEKMLLAPLRWKKPRDIFVNSMSDTFAEFVRDEWIDRIFAIMALTPQHRYQVLTKRAARMRDYALLPVRRNEIELAAERIKPSAGFAVSPKWCFAWPLPNVWLGVSAEDQQRADERIPLLLETPAAVRFVSLEPLLRAIDLIKVGACLSIRPALDWVIVGGESGPQARPAHPDWIRSLRDQCVSSGVPFFFKQHGSWCVIVDRDNDDPDWRADYTVVNHKPGYCIVNLAGGCGFHGERVMLMRRCDKKIAGRLLDGVEWNQMPERS